LFFFVYCGLNFDIESKNNLAALRKSNGSRLFFDHTSSHLHHRNRRRQRRKKLQRGCVSERKGVEMPRNKRKHVLGRCQKCQILTSPNLGKSLFYAELQHLNFIRTYLFFQCLTTVNPLDSLIEEDRVNLLNIK